MIFFLNLPLMTLIVMTKSLYLTEASECGFPGLPAHAIIFPGDQSQFSPGEIAQYECEDGRVRFGDGTRICRQTGGWSGNPIICSKENEASELRI